MTATAYVALYLYIAGIFLMWTIVVEFPKQPWVFSDYMTVLVMTLIWPWLVPVRAVRELWQMLRGPTP